MFLKKWMTGKNSRKDDGSRAGGSVWKKLCALAVCVCACGGAMWGDTYYRWTGTLTNDGTPQVQKYTGGSTDRYFLLTDKTDTGWENVTIATNLIDFITTNDSLGVSNKAYIFPHPNSTDTKIENFTFPQYTELSGYAGRTITVTGTLTVEGRIDSYSLINVSSTGKIIIDATGECSNVGQIVIENGGSITNNGTFSNTSSGTITNNGEITNSGTITNNGVITNDGTVTNDGTINTSDGDFYGTAPSGTGTVDTGTNNYVINGTDWGDDSSWVGGKVPELNENATVTITLNNDVTAGSLNFTRTGPYSINLNGHTLTVTNNIELNGNGTVLNVNGIGTVITEGFDTKNEYSSTVNFSSRVTFYINTTFFGNLSGSNKLTFTNYDGTSTLYIPSSGANVNYGPNSIVYEPDSKFLKGCGEPVTYTMSNDVKIDDGEGTITLTKTAADGSGGITVDFVYEIIKQNLPDAVTFTLEKADAPENGNNEITTNSSGKKVFRMNGTSDTSMKVKVTVTNVNLLETNQGFIIVVSTPDNSGLELGQFRFIKDEIRWIGDEDTNWSKGANWSIGEKPDDTADVIIPSGCKNYPNVEGDYTVGSVTIKNNANIRLLSGSLTVTNLSTEGTGYIKYVAGDTGTVNFKGKSSWSADNPEESEFPNISIDNDADTTFTPTSDLYIKGNFTNSGAGTFDGSGVKTVFIPSEVATVTGNDFSTTKFGSLSCTNQSGKTISFAGNIFVQNLSLSGTSGGLLKVIGESAKINLSKTQKSGQYLDLSDAQNIPLIVNSNGDVDKENLNFTAYNSTGTADELWERGWRAGPAGVYVWNGVTTDWNNRVNWNKNAVPQSGSQVLIPSGCDLYPKLAGNIDLGNGEIIVENGASLDLDTFTFKAKKITIEGTIKLNGSQSSSPLIVLDEGGVLSFDEDSTIEYTGGTEISPLTSFILYPKETYEEFYNLTITSSAYVSITGNINVLGKLENNGSLKLTGNLIVEGTTTTSTTITTTAGNQTYYGDFTVTGNGKVNVAIGEGTALLFNGAVTGESGSSVELVFGVPDDIWKNKTVTFKKGISGLRNFKSFYKTVFDGCSSVEAESYIELKNSVTLENDLSLSATKAETSGWITFDKSITGTDLHKLTVTSKGSTIKFAEANEFSNLEIIGSDNPVKVQFAAGELQKIKACSFKGSSTANTLTLTSTDTANNWKVLFGTPKPADENFEYVLVEYSTSSETTEPWLTQSADHASDLNETTNWFKKVAYHWIGEKSEKWEDKENWKYSVTDSSSVLESPKENSIIFISTGSGCHDLDLGSGVDFGSGKDADIQVKTLTVEEGKRIDIGSCTIEATECDSNSSPVKYGVINYGTICLEGTNTTPFEAETTVWHSNGKEIDDSTETGIYSTIEYDGNALSKKITSLPLYVSKEGGVKTFCNLIFSNGANVEASEKIMVTGSTKIFAGAGGVVSLLNGSNQYYGTGQTDELIIGNSSVSGGAVKIFSDNEIKIKSNVYCKTLDLQTPVNFDAEEILISADKVTFNKNVKSKSLTAKTDIEIADNVSLTNTGLFKIDADKTITVKEDKSFKQDDDSGAVTLGNIVLGGSLITSGDSSKVSFDTDVLATGATSDVIFGGGTNEITFNKNLIVNYPFDKVLNKVASLTSASPINVAGNFVLYSGEVIANKDVTVTGGDIILLGENYKITDQSTGIQNYVYNQYRGTTETKIDCNYTETNLPDGNAAPSLSTEFPADKVPFHGKFTAGNGVTIKAEKNFYANGLSISGTDWKLSISKNSDASSFSEAYNCTAENSNAICNDDPTDDSLAKVNAYECTDSGGNTNWDFDDFEIFSAETINHNTVKVEFSSAVRNPLADWSDAGTLKYSNGKYIEIYSTPACESSELIPANGTIEADDDGNFIAYFRAGGTWNTDATGKSAGHATSTDMTGTHQTSFPCLDFARTVSNITTKNNLNVLMTKWGKRINNYHPTTSPATPESVKTFDGTTDGASPVLISVATGQEVHKSYAGTAESQPSYDAHNFIELVYSEPVDFDNTPASGGTINIPAFKDEAVNYFQNVRAEESLGKIENSESGILISGILEISKGKVVSGAIDSSDGKTVHSFYRKDGMTPQSIRLSIAGYTDGTITDNDGKEYKKWIGYIDKSETPDGKITAYDSDYIKDLAGNKFLSGGIKNDLQVTKPDEKDYGDWDTLNPSFAIYRKVSRQLEDAVSDGYYEAIGSTDGSTSLTQIEFHLFDNAPLMNNSAELQWVSRKGWVKKYDPDITTEPELYKDFTYAADNFGGARAYDDVPTRRTTGGIRYSSLLLDASRNAFKYIEGSDMSLTPSSPFNNSKKAYYGASAPMFLSMKGDVRNSDAVDGLYFGYVLNESVPSLQTTFIISYDGNTGCITDLAGNRLSPEKQTKIKTRDVTAPSIALSVAPVGQNKLYLMFTKRLTEDDITMKNTTSGKEETMPALKAFAEAFELKKISEGTVYNKDNPIPEPESEIKIDDSVPARFLFRNLDYSGIELTLTKNVSFDDLQNVYVVVKNLESTYADPNTALPTDTATFVQDEAGNYASSYAAHALSDFAVNVVNPLYAYNENYNADDSSKIQLNYYGDGSNAVHDWSAEQGNYGTLLPEDEIHIISEINLDNGTQYDDDDFKVKMYVDRNPPAETLSVEYNKTAKPSDPWRIWFPKITGYNPFLPIAEDENGSFEFTLDGSVPLSSIDYDMEFIFTEEKVSNWNVGDQIKFMFSLTDSSDNPLEVVHVPVYDYSTSKYSLSDKFPLFALRLKRPNDLTSLDLWSFKLKSQASQRGGVSIFNNVIDANKSEKTVIKIDNPKNGRVDVIVMTLDGNVVTYLNRGDLAGGEHYFTWNGRTQNGKAVARGIYFVRVIGNGFDETRKVMVTK